MNPVAPVMKMVDLGILSLVGCKEVGRSVRCCGHELRTDGRREDMYVCRDDVPSMIYHHGVISILV
jgi:hypothetical protein